MWTIGYIHYITNKIAYITYSHVDQDIPYQLKCDKGLFHAWDIIAVGLQEHANSIQVCNELIKSWHFILEVVFSGNIAP